MIFNKAIGSLKLSSVQLSTLISALEAKGITTDCAELRRLSVKLFESTFMENTESILKTEEISETTPCNLEVDPEQEWEEEIVETFFGEDDCVMEVRKIRPKSKSKGKSLYKKMRRTPKYI